MSDHNAELSDMIRVHWTTGAVTAKGSDWIGWRRTALKAVSEMECAIAKLHADREKHLESQAYFSAGECSSAIRVLTEVLAKILEDDGDAKLTGDVFRHSFFGKAPAFAALRDNGEPKPDHLRACLMELLRYVLPRLGPVQAEHNAG